MNYVVTERCRRCGATLDGRNPDQILTRRGATDMDCLLDVDQPAGHDFHQVERTDRHWIFKFMGLVLQIAIIPTAIVTICEESKKATVKDSILLFQTFIGFDIALVAFGVCGIVSLLRDHVFSNNPMPGL
eukprot:UN08896